MQQNTQEKSRRQIAYVSILGTTQLHLRSPWVIAWWSCAFPGLGHMLLSKYIRGYIIFIWEIIINFEANVNLGLLYTFTGRFEAAKQVLNTRWLILYFPIYFFTIWDSYRSTVDMNAQYIMAAREDAEIKPFIINGIEVNYLDKRSPWVSAAWSLLMPGIGQLYMHRITVTIFISSWWIVSIYYSNLCTAIYYTFLGDFANAAMVLNPHWLLNIPSIYLFAVYDAYVNTVENNKLYDWEQNRFLKRDYLNPAFIMPSINSRKEDRSMYIVSTFEHSRNLELAITAVQMKGIAKENILAVPMDKRDEKRSLFDTIHYADGLSLLDLPLIFATVLSIFGAIYGFILPWGPVIWGLIGIFAGLCLGLAIRLLTTRKYACGRQEKNKATEVVVIVNCKDHELETVREIFWDNHALGVRKLDLTKNIV